jgi:hypothetical protein
MSWKRYSGPSEDNERKVSLSCVIVCAQSKGINPLWLIGVYTPAGLKLFFKMSKNYE